MGTSKPDRRRDMKQKRRLLVVSADMQPRLQGPVWLGIYVDCRQSHRYHRRCPGGRGQQHVS